MMFAGLMASAGMAMVDHARSAHCQTKGSGPGLVPLHTHPRSKGEGGVRPPLDLCREIQEVHNKPVEARTCTGAGRRRQGPGDTHKGWGTRAGARGHTHGLWDTDMGLLTCTWGAGRARGLGEAHMGGIFAVHAHCALLLDYVPPEEPPSKPLGNALRIR